MAWAEAANIFNGLVIFRMGPELRVLLVDALRRDCHSENDVGFDFACVQRGVEQPPLDCAMVEHRM